MIGLVRENLYRLRGSRRYQRLHELEKLQYLPTGELRRLQFGQLSALVRYAYETVPYYRRSFEKLGIVPDDIRSFEEYSRLPILTRKKIRENLPDLLSSACPEGQRILNCSGGTSGHPLQFYQDRFVYEEMEATFLFAFSLAEWRPSDMIVSIWGNPRDNAPASVAKRIKSWLGGVRRLNGFQYGKEEIQFWLEVIKSYRRVFIYGYVSILADVAEYILETKHTVGNVHGIITSAERLYPQQRELIVKAFRCNVYDQYGCREVPGIATECSEGNMHLMTYSAYTEFLPVEAGLDMGPLPAGESEEEPQRIVVTGFHNHAMPLLRYANNDMSRPKSGNCPCGRGFPLMQMDIGRLGSSLRLPNGKRAYCSGFISKVYAIPGIKAFQLRQTAIDEAQLYIVRDANFGEVEGRRLRELQDIFPKTLCPGITLHLHYVEDVPKTPAGKQNHVICEID